MKYYVIYVSNGAIQVDKITEWDDISKAKAKFHSVCNALWSEKTVLKASVVILDEQLDIVEDYKEFITHPEPQPEPEPTPEPEPEEEPTE